MTANCCKPPADGCKKCENNKLVNEADGKPADDGDPCTTNDRCQGGKAKGDPGGRAGTPDCGGATPQIRYVNKETTNSMGENSTTTYPSGFQLGGEFCYDRASQSMGYQIKELVVPIDITVARDGYVTPNPVVGGNVNAGNYCDIITELTMYRTEGRGLNWHSIDASLAHERYHRDVDIPRRLLPLWAEFVKDINSTRAECIRGQFDTGFLDTIRRLKLDTLRAKYAAASTEDNIAHDNDKDDGAYKAGQAVLDKIIERIDALAAAQQFPVCNGGGIPLRPAAAGPRLTNVILVAAATVLGVGQNMNVTVLALYNDGSVTELSAANANIQYLVTDPAVAFVDANGRVTAIASGSTLVQAIYLPGRDALPLTPCVQIYVGSTEDRDSDGIPNAYELMVGSNPDDPNDSELDADGDGLNNLKEFLRATDPLNPDTDGDGLGDGLEVEGGQDPLRQPVLDASWQVQVSGQTVQVNSDGSFTIPNVSAPDLFGPGGPGTAPDFLSDDFVRLTGQGTILGKTYYVFSEPFQFRARQTFMVDNLTFTPFPPLLPES
ncbi:MAG TPA: Ig-like domain-containing protein, partial [Pirellulaceae bacterium]